MEFPFKIALDYCFSLSSEPYTIVFLISDAGVRMPFMVDNDEFADLLVALEEGEGAMPPLIASEAREVHEAGLTVTKVAVMEMDEEEQEFYTWIHLENPQNTIVKNCELFYGILFAIHAGIPIHIADDVLVRQAETEFCQNVFTVVEAFDEAE